MPTALFQPLLRFRKRLLEVVSISRIVWSSYHVPRIPLPPCQEQRVVNHADIDSEAVRRPSRSEIQQFTETVAIRDEINSCEVIIRLHGIKRCEHRLEGERRCAKGVLVYEMCASIFGQSGGESDRCPLWWAPRHIDCRRESRDPVVSAEKFESGAARDWGNACL